MITRFFYIFLLLSTFSVFSQDREVNTDSLRDQSDRIPAPTDIVVDPDTVPPASSDTLQVSLNDSLVSNPSGLSGEIKYFAKDSTIMDIISNKVYLYNDAWITYEDIRLEADRIVIDYEEQSLSAEGVEDSTGKILGQPVFNEGSQTYYVNKLKYNFQTERAIVEGIVTKQGEAIMHGKEMYKNEEDEIFISKTKYTTCNHIEPHYYISSREIKVIPNDKVISGPFNLNFMGVPTPLGFAFGMFPDTETKSDGTSGVIFPTFGEERRRGFFVRDFGYYFNISEYVKLSLTAEVYSKGSMGARAATSYKKRYAYNGNLDFTYNRLTSGIEGDTSVTKDFWLRWNHSPQSKGNSRFSASVNAGTSTYNQNNELNPNLNTRATFNSAVTFSTVFPNSPFNLSASARYNQNVQTKEVDLQFPDLSFGMNRIFPFRSLINSSRGLLGSASVSYNMAATNRITNKVEGEYFSMEGDTILPFNSENMPFFIERAKNGIRHTIPFGTSARIFRHFTLNPSFNYSEIWYFSSLEYKYNENLNRVVASDTSSGFNRVYNYSTSASLNTRIYGTYQFKQGSKIQAIRHIMAPALSYSYSPDFGEEKYGFYQYVDVPNQEEPQVLSKYQNYAYGGGSRGESQNLSFSLTNTVEGKVLDKNDSTSENPYEKIPLIENFSFNTGYNFALDSFNLNTFNFSFRTSLFNRKLSLNIPFRIDPYVYELTGVGEDGRVQQNKVDKYAWNEGRGIGQLTSASLALSTNLNGKGRESDNERRDELDEIAGENPELRETVDRINANPDLYLDWSIPWNLRINYNLSYTKRGFEEAQISQNVRFSGDFNLTENWKINFSSGYDFRRNEFSQTTIGINRNLHCWMMNVTWVPFGTFQSFNFEIRVRSSMLQDLKITRNRNFRDNPSFNF
ncbi:putative LPS assembly protein LptD [Mangrovivirga sp. M17]|uniref:LPS assembly protein LptD n=1 Tax=Mangrovivirga halotolerans TaxID=2993936 RepID=A0ABT3RUR8_9BACT|nr:putative LPS assembly protein LptD [Mangrovivirga halotolerans]MCX2744997.1 putative LPS assembly protein LptD [Mangrovivirga halotolerans]